jgi:hypothetical protein
VVASQADQSYGTVGTEAQLEAGHADDDDEDSFDDDFSDDEFDDGQGQPQEAGVSAGAASAAHVAAPTNAVSPVAAIAHARMLYEFGGANDNELAAPEVRQWERGRVGG